MSKITKTEWYERVNAAWPPNVPVLSDEEARRAGKRLYRFGMKRTFRGTVRITSGNRYTWIRRGEMVINPRGSWEPGWKGMVHMISHYCHQRLHPTEQPHGGVHARLELRMIKEVIKRGWLEGKLKAEPKQPKPAPTVGDKIAALRLREKRWTTKIKRAATALSKIRRKIKWLEKRDIGFVA